MGAFNNWNWDLFKSAITKALQNGGTPNDYKGGVVGWDDNASQEWNTFVETARKYGLTDSQILATINAYKPDSLFGGGFNLTDAIHQMTTDIEEMNSWYNLIGDAPVMPNAEDYYQEAEDTINAENKELLALYDEIFNKERNTLEKSMNENNAMFSDYRNTVLTNEAMQQQAIAGATRYELDRQQRNAISRGASAAQRLVGNINTSLGLQAQSAQQALDTSNALAQNLLAHRQANQSIRNDYMNAQRDDSLRRADLIKGRSERIANYQNTKLGQAMDAYDLKNQAYNDRLSKVSGTNPWSSAWTSWYTKNQNNKNAI